MTEPGELLGGRYRVREVLRGGMGQIFISELERDAWPADSEPSDDETLQVALKTFQRRYFFDNAARQSFIREASTWLRLSGLPHVMPVLWIDHIGDQPYIVMPAVPAGPAGERSIADLLRQGPVDPQSALAFAFQIALALHRAAGRIEGLAHGDLKPANVLLPGGNAHLSDFGLVSAVTFGRPDVRLKGTWDYRAPELWADGPVAPSVASDIYAFGALLFEMLVGRPPFRPESDSPEAWSAAHRDRRPEVPESHPSTGLPAAVMALALACLAKDPSGRPPDFAAVLHRIHLIYQDVDPAGEILLMMKARDIGDFMGGVLAQTRLRRVDSLLSLHEPGQALEELEAIPSSEYDADLWVARGTALSMLDRPDEAIEALERGLAGELTPARRIDARSEYALALKQLHRFTEAREIYESLMTEVPDDRLSIVVVNLATLYLADGKGDEVVRLLGPFVRRTPQVPEAWANLGLGYVLVGRYDDAVAAYGRALILAPQDGRIRVYLAAAYMDHLGELEQAWTALDAAFDAGHESREWFVRMLASSLLLGKEETVRGMLWAAEHNMPKDLADGLVAEATEMARRLAEQYAREPEEPAVTEPRSEQTGGIKTAMSDVGVEDEPYSTDSTGPGDAVGRPTLPFLTFRYYDFFDFTLDYYQWPEATDFVPQFLTKLRGAMRDPRVAVGGATLRGSPFYFTVCPSCGISVLTNRDVGKRIACRMCGTSWPTVAVQGPAFDPIVAQVSATLKIPDGEGTAASHVYVLFVQPPDAASVDVVKDVCRDAGMVELGKSRLMSIYLLRDAINRGMAKLGRPWSVWRLTPSEPEAWAPDSTPRVISEIVRQLQDRVPGVVTLSSTVTAEEMASMDETIEEIEEEQERTARQALRSGAADARDLRRLASILISRGEFREAERKARAAVAADEDSAEGWQIVGWALLKQEDLAGARDALEESLARDATSVLVLMMLASCYERLGDAQRAAELNARATSLSGGEFG
jgi:serine/threonine protein kinase/Flp pilus assembly protein TadD